jgi:phosphatidyl-myo-inositol dimannoside synthase
MSKPRELCLVAPGLFDRGGGIARIARATSLACSQVCAERGWKLTALSLLDRGEVRDDRYLPAGADYLTFGGNRLALARALLSRAWSDSHAGTIFCHVNLASLGLFYPRRRPASARQYVVVAHGVDVWGALPPHRRYALRVGREVWPVSGFTGRMLRNVQGVGQDRIRTIYNCLDPFWSAVAGPDSVKDGRYVLCVSRLARSDRYKGVEDLIAAFNLAAGRLGALRLVVVGDGDDAARLWAVAAKGAAAKQINFRGAVDDIALRDLYDRCEIFALPSRKEGFGLVFLEAMAHGKPVVAADSTATPEVVVNGETGVLVPYGDVAKLADALISLGDDPKLARDLGARGLERVRQRFSFQRYLDDVRAAISQLWGSAVETGHERAGTA